jgi:transcriptional regulator with XRE-family HTH domain
MAEPTTRKARKQKNPSLATESTLTGTKRRRVAVRAVNLSRPGAALMALLFEEAGRRGMNQGELADELGVHYSYLSGLRSGTNSVPKIGADLIGKIAAFMGLPRIAVMLAAGQLTLEDFYYAPDAISDYLVQALRTIQTDKVFGPITPPEIFEVSRPIQLLLITLYEEVRKQTLIPGRVTPEKLAERFGAFLATPDKPG